MRFRLIWSPACSGNSLAPRIASWMNSPGGAVRRRAELVEGALALPPGLHQAGVLQQPQMRRDARLAHPRDLLQLVDRQFVLLQQRHDAQARGVGQGAEGFEGGGIMALIFAKYLLTTSGR